jgi:hypothetical protein
MLKMFILSFLIINSVICFAQETIIDTVYSDMNLDGDITYWRIDDIYEVDTNYYAMTAGDFGVGEYPPPWSQPNSVKRSYISFNLPDILVGYSVDSVFVRLYQYFSAGDDDIGEFPVWSVTDGDTIKCLLNHIVYGDELDEEDWEKGDIGNHYTIEHNAGIVTESAASGYRNIDVTDNVIADYAMQRIRTQYRIAFEIETDWDNEYDMVDFISGDTASERFPILVIRFIEESSVEDIIPESSQVVFSPFPNPFNPIVHFEIKFSNTINEHLLIEIFNVKGQVVDVLPVFFDSAQGDNVVWNADDHGSGVYYCKLVNVVTDEVLSVRKITLLK